jgi:hypothetical protein
LRKGIEEKRATTLAHEVQIFCKYTEIAMLKTHKQDTKIMQEIKK